MKWPRKSRKASSSAGVPAASKAVPASALRRAGAVFGSPLEPDREPELAVARTVDLHLAVDAVEPLAVLGLDLAAVADVEHLSGVELEAPAGKLLAGLELRAEIDVAPPRPMPAAGTPAAEDRVEILFVGGAAAHRQVDEGVDAEVLAAQRLEVVEVLARDRLRRRPVGQDRRVEHPGDAKDDPGVVVRGQLLGPEELLGALGLHRRIPDVLDVVLDHRGAEEADRDHHQDAEAEAAGAAAAGVDPGRGAFLCHGGSSAGHIFSGTGTPIRSRSS